MSQLGRRGIDRKFEHALEIAGRVDQFAADYVASEPIELIPVDDNPLGMAEVKVRLALDEMSLGILVGDAVHAARTALDHLAWRLVEVGGGSPSRSTQFPIQETSAGFADLARKQLRGASLRARQMVKELEPYLGGDVRFVVLNQLDIADKHHMLLPTVFTAAGLMLSAQAGRRVDGQMVYEPQGMDVMLSAADPDPVVDGLLVQRPSVLSPFDDDPDQEIGLRMGHAPAFAIHVGAKSAGKDLKVNEIAPLISGIQAAVEPIVQLVV